MKRFYALLLTSLALLLTTTSCHKEKHFITDKEYRAQVHADFFERQELAAGRADALFADAEKESYDVVLLPGGPGTGGLKVPPVFERLRRQKAEGRLIAAICAAPTVLVDAGVLDPGQHVTCYPTCSVDLDRPCANVPVVADGGVITGQAPGAAMLFALVVLRALLGDAVAGKVARGLVTDVL